MSQDLTGTVVGTIYGSLDDALVYIGSRLGDAYAAFRTLVADDQKRALVTAAGFLDTLPWIEGYYEFEDRDAEPAIVAASYELAALIAEDPVVVTLADQSSNIQSVNAGGAGVTYFERAAAPGRTHLMLPVLIERLLGEFLGGEANASLGGLGGPIGRAGSACNPFAGPYGYGWPLPWRC